MKREWSWTKNKNSKWSNELSIEKAKTTLSVIIILIIIKVLCEAYGVINNNISSQWNTKQWCLFKKMKDSNNNADQAIR